MAKIMLADNVVLHIVHRLKSSGCFDLHAELAEPAEPIVPQPVALSQAGQPYAPSDRSGVVPHPDSSRPVQLAFRLSGPDLPLLVRDHGDLLNAIHHIAIASLKLRGCDAISLSLSAGPITVGRVNSRGAKLGRAADRLEDRRIALQDLAAAAITRVSETAIAYTFEPMTGTERRILHDALVPSGLKSSTTGEGSKRRVVLYPPGVKPPAGRPRPPLARGTGKPRSA